MTRYLHYLRIGFSGLCGIACVLLLVLWVRSFETRYHIFVDLDGSGGYLDSDDGKISIGTISTQQSLITLPYWSLIFASVIFAVAPWLPYRFTLRTLLIAITLIGLILGTIVVLSK